MPIVSYPTLAAILVALASGWATRYHCRKLLHEGIGLEDGGGYTALILVEFTVFVAAVGVALNG